MRIIQDEIGEMRMEWDEKLHFHDTLPSICRAQNVAV
jgi:hypothetical protein